MYSVYANGFQRKQRQYILKRILKESHTVLKQYEKIMAELSIVGELSL